MRKAVRKEAVRSEDHGKVVLFKLVRESRADAEED